jgi:eukaryotic-like serine/threonine-protein kinase
VTATTESLRTALADRYRLERDLGAGGMATVYLAHDEKHDRKVALKVLRPELAAVIGADRFLQEIKVTANLQHSHILPLYDSGAADNFLFYVMPYVEGETLRTRLDREKQLGVDDAVALTRAIASALEYAHKQGVVHRDIKPENILLRDSDPLIADFGIALAVSHAGGNRLTETGLSIGTPHYMSPEQAMGDRELDARSDVYSLGAVLYEMLTGEPPHTGSTAQAIVARVITEDPRPITTQRRTVPPHVADAVHKALNKLPADRFSSAASFAEALVTPGYVTPTRTRAGTAAPPARRFDGRLAVTAALLVVMTGLAGWGLLRGEPEPPSFRMRVAIASHPIPPGLVGRDLALSPDGRTMAFSDTVGGTRQLWVKTADRAEAEPLTGSQNGRAPTFSPDGQWIAFVAEGRIRKVPITGGAAVTVGDSAEANLLPSVAWLDNGTIAYGALGGGSVRVVGQDGGLRHRVDVFATAGMGAVAIDPLPGGEAVLLGLCTFGCPTARLAVLDIPSGAIDSLADGALRGWYIEGGLVAFARQDGGVLAGPFDVGRRRFSAPPIPVLEGVQSGDFASDIVIAANGTLLYVPGLATLGAIPVEVVWVTRDGRAAPVDSPSPTATASSASWARAAWPPSTSPKTSSTNARSR